MRDARRTAVGAVARLDRSGPTITLNRVQSGTGSLEVRILTPPGTGALTAGCVMQLANQTNVVVREGGDNLAAPTHALGPLARLRSGADEDVITWDLRRVGDLRRALVYAQVPVTAPPTTGTLVLTTSGGPVAEATFQTAPGSVLVLLSLHNVAGELVVRAETDVLPDFATAWRNDGYDVTAAS